VRVRGEKLEVNELLEVEELAKGGKLGPLYCRPRRLTHSRANKEGSAEGGKSDIDVEGGKRTH